MEDANSEEALLFNSHGIFEAANSDNLKSVSHLADQILCNCAVIDLDNQVLAIEHCRT